jgi:hypothetical protein
MPEKSIYATPREVLNIDECTFYHTMEIPGYGKVDGIFDLRKNFTKSLGGVNLQGKKVLEMGTADGFLCFSMERLGAEVTAYDLSSGQSWDIVPYARDNFNELDQQRKAHIESINNAYWYCHRAFQSRAKMVYGSVYAVPEEIGPVDIATFGAILLHVRDPFLALQSVLAHTRETVIISEPLWGFQLPAQIFSLILGPYLTFVPDFRKREPNDTWWFLSLSLLRQYIGILGFEKTRVTYYYQRFKGKPLLHYTLVGTRTVPLTK